MIRLFQIKAVGEAFNNFQAFRAILPMLLKCLRFAAVEEEE